MPIPLRFDTVLVGYPSSFMAKRDCGANTRRRCRVEAAIRYAVDIVGVEKLLETIQG